jgi:Anti-sigma factor NepR
MTKKPARAAPPLHSADQRAIEQALSQKLKDYYDQMAQQSVPQHLLDLLDQLDGPPKSNKN